MIHVFHIKSTLYLGNLNFIQRFLLLMPQHFTGRNKFQFVYKYSMKMPFEIEKPKAMSHIQQYQSKPMCFIVCQYLKSITSNRKHFYVMCLPFKPHRLMDIPNIMCLYHQAITPSSNQKPISLILYIAIKTKRLDDMSSSHTQLDTYCHTIVI